MKVQFEKDIYVSIFDMRLTLFILTFVFEKGFLRRGIMLCSAFISVFFFFFFFFFFR